MSALCDTSSTPDSSLNMPLATQNFLSASQNNVNNSNNFKFDRFDSPSQVSLLDSKLDLKEKVERCQNFSEAEKQRFIELFEESKEVLLNNGRKPNLAEIKKETWDRVRKI